MKSDKHVFLLLLSVFILINFVSADTYAHWHLNEASGTNVSDASGNERHGITVNMENEDWISGKLNNALTFDGINEHVNTGNISAFERTDPFSFEFWFKTDTASVDVLLDRYGSSGWSIYMDSGKITVVLTHDVADYIKKETNDIYNNDSWQHLIVTYDGSSIASGVLIYINGQVVSTTVVSDTLTDTILNPDVNCSIASRGTALYFDGEMDEIVIYNHTIDQTSVTFRYNSGIGTELIYTESVASSSSSSTSSSSSSSIISTSSAVSSSSSSSTSTSSSSSSSLISSTSSSSSFLSSTSSSSSSSSSSTTTLPYQITESGIATGTPRTGDGSSTYTVGSLKGREQYWNFSEVSGTPAFMAYFNITGIPSTCGFNISQYIWYYGSIGHDVYLELYNWNLSDWMILDEVNATANFVWHNISICDYEQNYTNAGVAWFRYNHVTAGNVNHWQALDMFLLTTDSELVVSSSSSSSSSLVSSSVSSSSSIIASTSSSQVSSSSSSSSSSIPTTTMINYCNDYRVITLVSPYINASCSDMLTNETCFDKYQDADPYNLFYLNYSNCEWNETDCITDVDIPCTILVGTTTTTTTTLCNMKITSAEPGIDLCIGDYCNRSQCVTGDRDYFATWKYSGLKISSEYTPEQAIWMAAFMVIGMALLMFAGVMISTVMFLITKVLKK